VGSRLKLLAVCSVLVALSIAGLYVAPRQTVRESLPQTLTDSEFWDLVTDFSEPGGYFRSENFVSNESAFQHVIPDLKRQVRPGGVYLGVGPDQNFTYVSALMPRLAFIVDIRRQNMMLHLMYKALFELSNNRIEFLSKLFARPAPTGLSETTTTEDLFAAFAEIHSDQDLAKTNLEAIVQHLREQHHFDLGADDANSIGHVYNAFVAAGPEIRYSFPNQYAWRRFPSYAELMLETDGTSEQEGVNHSYLASETNFQAVKVMESQNRIVPIVGDFAGTKALRSVGNYVRKHGATVSAFYTSNVEFYLFQTEDWRKFLDTISDFPINGESVIIRSYFNNYGMQFPTPPGWLYSAPPSYSLLDNFSGFTRAFSAGRIGSYFDVVRRSKP
jgi:hypothetical protein